MGSSVTSPLFYLPEIIHWNTVWTCDLNNFTGSHIFLRHQLCVDASIKGIYEVYEPLDPLWSPPCA